jgi:small subunit ribosomal protein S12
MATMIQLVRGARKHRKPHYTRSKALLQRPHVKAVVIKPLIQKPKKPNSALRKIVKARLLNKSKKTIKAHIPGEGHTLKEHSTILIRGGRTKDLPGINYKVVRGKWDCLPLPQRRRSRSKFAVKRS